ncbi:Ku protein [Faecalimonas umbilicata]|uniref:Ku protein n=1 Tax=Faecalimonas umbilicata TaxID=1912855 RepID=UPI0022E02B2E|nr:Ku protein [Faecalimonas umbilicata]
MAEVNMIYYEKDYYAVPDTGAEKAYELLRQALLAQKKVAIAKIVMGTNEKLLVLYPTKEGIIVKTLFYYDEIAAIPKSVPRMKLDGFRCLAYIDYGMVDLRNKRNIRMLPRSPELKEISKNVGGRCILDGEIVVLTNGVPDFYRLQKRTLLTDKFKIEMEASRLVNEDSRISVSRYVEGSGTALYMAQRRANWKALLQKEKTAFI